MKTIEKSEGLHESAQLSAKTPCKQARIRYYRSIQLSPDNAYFNTVKELSRWQTGELDKNIVFLFYLMFYPFRTKNSNQQFLGFVGQLISGDTVGITPVCGGRPLPL